MALAAAVCLRPSLGEELIRLTGLRGGPALGSAGPGGLSAGANPCASGACSLLGPRAPGVQSVPWPATPADESFAGDGQLGFPSPPRYQSAAEPPNRYSPEVARWPQGPPSPAEPQRSARGGGIDAPGAPPAGPTYPAAGAGRDDLRPLAPPEPAQEQLSSPPLGPYPMAGPNSLPSHRNKPMAPGLAQARPCEGTEVLARVGNDVILASEVMPQYNEYLARFMARIPESQLAAIPKDQFEREKRALLARLLNGHVETKLVYQDAKRTIPEERLPEFQRKIADHFVKEELPKRIEKSGVASAAEYDEKLRAMGSSLERMKRTFVQQALAAEWSRGQRDADPKVSHGEMLDYYHEHHADYETPARARWEKISVRIPRYSDGREARARLAQMGNQLIAGRSIAEVLAVQPKDGLECRGGVQGWVTQGSMEVSETIEQGVFSLPAGRLSGIFRDGGAYHIIRVLQREPLQRTPFEDPEIQNEIREQIRKQRRDEQMEQYLARLRKQFPVWTVFDDDPELAELSHGSDPSRN